MTPRHNIFSNVRADIRQYVVSWRKRSREKNRPLPGPMVIAPAASLSLAVAREIALYTGGESHFQE